MSGPEPGPCVPRSRRKKGRGLGNKPERDGFGWDSCLGLRDRGLGLGVGRGSKRSRRKCLEAQDVIFHLLK